MSAPVPAPIDPSLSGRVAIVLGAGSSAGGWSNGRATAVAYARAGAHVVAVDVCGENLAGTQASMTQEGHACIICVADVTRSADLAAVVATTESAFGRIDVLHFNVGIATFGSLADTTEESWNQVLSANLTGAFKACRLVLPIMARQRRGVITAVSSVAADRVSRAPTLAYNVSKAGLEQLVRSVAVLHAEDGIRANVVRPGLLDTPVNRSLVGQPGYFASDEERRRVRSAAVPLGFMGDAWDVANASVFLASDHARYITGATLAVDGGLECKLM